ncbi:hypothetical protein PENTCL1PPCAC_2189, partial [Pristionchus entomophagus]
RSARTAARKVKEEEEEKEREGDEGESKPKKRKMPKVEVKEEEPDELFSSQLSLPSIVKEEGEISEDEEEEEGEVEDEEDGQLDELFPRASKDKEVISCPLCQKECIGKYGLEHHFRKEHKNDDIPPVFECDLCDKSYKRYSCLQKHKRLTHLRKIKTKKEGAVACPLCDAKFSGNYVLSDHLRLEHGEVDIRPFECDICGLPNRTANALRNHKKKHLPARGEFHCEICEMHFPKYTGLERHQKQRHGMVTDSALAMQPKEFPCPLCEERYSYQSHLDTHLEKDHADVDSGNFECIECGRSFKTHRAVVAHKKTHQTTPFDARNGEIENKFPCDLCARRFEKWEGLVFHQRQVHQTVSEECKKLEKEIDYGVQCPVCEQYYKGNHALSCHIQKDHPDFEGRLFVCVDCDAGFKHYARLRQHRTHKHGVPVKFKQGYLKANPELKRVKDAERRMKRSITGRSHTGGDDIKVEIEEGEEISEEMLMKLMTGEGLVKEEPIDWDEVEEEEHEAKPGSSGINLWTKTEVKKEEPEDSLSESGGLCIDEGEEGEIERLQLVKKEEPVCA